MSRAHTGCLPRLQSGQRSNMQKKKKERKELHLIKRNIKLESSMQQISKVSLRVASKMGFVFSLRSLLSASLRLIV